MGARQSAEMARALVLIIEEGKTAAEAARATGISKAAISMNAQYRAHRAALQTRSANSAANSSPVRSKT